MLVLPPFKYHFPPVILRGKEKQHFLLLDQLSSCSNLLKKLMTFWPEKSKNLSSVLLPCFQLSCFLCAEMGLWCPSRRTKSWTLAGRRHLRSGIFLFSQAKIVVDQIWEALRVTEFSLLPFLKSGKLSLGTRGIESPRAHLRCTFAEVKHTRSLISSGSC